VNPTTRYALSVDDAEEGWCQPRRASRVSTSLPVVQIESAASIATVRRNDLPVVVSNSPSKTQNAEVTVDGDGKVKFWVEPGGATDHGALGGLTDDDHTQYSLADGTRQFAAAPNCAAADANPNDLIRNTEVNNVVIALLTLIAGKQDVDADLTSWAAIARASGFDTFAATPSSANLRSLLTDETGTGAAVFATSPTLVTPALGTPSSGNLSNCTSLPAASVTGLGSLATQSTRSMDVCFVSIYVTGMAWSAMPSAHTFAFGSAAFGCVRRLDLTSFTQVRLRVVQANAAASGAKIRIRYATSGPGTLSNYAAMGASATEVDVSLATGAGPTFLESSWINLTASAIADVYVAITGISGNGSTSPSFWSICAEFR
jgi:hypothetical protein